MSHDIEITADGKAQFVGAREPAWHRLGTIFEDQDGITVSKVLETLDCGRIETVPVFGILQWQRGSRKYVLESPWKPS